MVNALNVVRIQEGWVLVWPGPYVVFVSKAEIHLTFTVPEPCMREVLISNGKRRTDFFKLCPCGLENSPKL